MFETRCPQCNKSFNHQDGRQRFCSRSCSATHNNLASKIGRPRWKRTPCPGCGSTSQKERKLIYCSMRCKKEHQVNLWLRGEYEADKFGSTPDFIRRYLLEAAGNKCEQCSWAEIHPVLGYSPLEVDHIDGNSRNPTRSNLRVLCPNCHALTPTFRHLNRNRGRLRKA